jgi:hypothetical protein
VFSTVVVAGAALVLSPHGTNPGHMQVSHNGPNATAVAGRHAHTGSTPPDDKASGPAGQPGAGTPNGSGLATNPSGRGATGTNGSGNGTGPQTHTPATVPLLAPPESAAPVSSLVVELHDDGLYLSATNVTDLVDITFRDVRSNTAQPVQLDAPDGEHSVNGEFTPKLALGGPATLTAAYASNNATVARADVNVAARTTPGEDAHTITITLNQDGSWTLPNRSAGQNPSVKGQPKLWTDVAGGAYTLVVLNPYGLLRTFTVTGNSNGDTNRYTVHANQKQQSFAITLAPNADHTWVIQPVDQTRSNNGEGLVLWGG